MAASLHEAPARSTKKFPRPPYDSLPDDVQAEQIARQADALEAVRDTLLRALNTLAKSTYEQPSNNRYRARKLVLEAWVSLAGVARDLATPVPKFRAGSTGYRPTVQPRYRDAEVAGVEDLRPVSLPLPGWVAR